MAPRRIALVSQELSLAGDLSVEDNVWLGSRDVPFFQRTRALRRRAADAIATLGLEPAMLDRPVNRLSIAERQLVEIARGLCRERDTALASLLRSLGLRGASPTVRWQRDPNTRPAIHLPALPSLAST